MRRPLFVPRRRRACGGGHGSSQALNGRVVRGPRVPGADGPSRDDRLRECAEGKDAPVQDGLETRALQVSLAMAINVLLWYNYW